MGDSVKKIVVQSFGQEITPADEQMLGQKTFIITEVPGPQQPQGLTEQQVVNYPSQRESIINLTDLNRKYPEPVKPPFPLSWLSILFTNHPAHYAAVEFKAKSIAFGGIKLVKSPIATSTDTTPPKELLRFYHEDFNPDLGMEEVLKRCEVDYQTTGNCFMEVIPRNNGQIKQINHAPASTMLILPDEHPMGFAQMIDGKIVAYFRRAGDLSSDRRRFEGKLVTEMIHMGEYHPSSGYYGIPSVITNLRQILGSEKADEFLVRQLARMGVVPLAFIFKNADPNDVESEESLKKFFGREVQGGKAVLKLDLPPGVEIQVEKLATEFSPALFTEYDAVAEQKIARSHGIPPLLLDIQGRGQRQASQGELEAQFAIFHDTYFIPRSKAFNRVLTQRINRLAFGIEDWNLELRPVSLANLAEQSKIDDGLQDRGVLTINQRLAKLGLPAVEGGDRNLINSGGVPIDANSGIPLAPKPQQGSPQPGATVPSPSLSSDGPTVP